MSTEVAALSGKKVVWKPYPKQELAMGCPAFELLFGGSKGGAKTAYLVACVLPLLAVAHRKWKATGVKQRRCRIMVFRKNLEDLKDFEIKAHELYPAFDPDMGTDGWHANSKTWTFTSGATISLRHLDGPTDHLGYNGNEFVALLFDEVQQISYEAYSFLVAQVRTADEDYKRWLMVRATANPGGYDWLITHFAIDQHPQGGKIISVPIEVNGKVINITRAFIRSYLRDNPALWDDGVYEARLRATMNPDEVAMFLEGDFFRVAGAFFAKHIRHSLHFVRSRPIPDDCEMGFAIDWGGSVPACLLVGALDKEGCLWIIDEIHMPGDTGEKFGEHMQRLWKEQTWSPQRKWAYDDFYGVIDKQAFDRNNGTDTAGAGIMAKGFRIFPAEKERSKGCNQMKTRLSLNRKGEPRLRVFEDKCPHLVRALTGIKSNAPEKPDEYEPRSQFSHACDTARFLMMRFPVNPTDVVTPTVDAEIERWNRLFAAQAAATPPDNYNRMTTGYDH